MTAAGRGLLPENGLVLCNVCIVGYPEVTL
jgi:hypothetical protein